MKLLIVSFLFPPSHNVGALRVGKTAKHLLAMGYDVRVLTASNSLYPLGLPLEIPSERVVYTRWIDVNHPFYWIKDKNIDKSVNVTKSNVEVSSSLYTVLRSIYKFCLHRPDSVIGWLPFALRAGDALFKSWVPDLIYASAAPYTSLVVAKKLSQRYGIQWVAELRDLWADNSCKRSDFIEQRIEKNTLLTASALITVSDGLCNTLKMKYKQPRYVVKNAYDPEDMLCLPKINCSNEKLSIIYTGLVYKGMQDPGILFKAVSESYILKSKVSISFYGDNNDWIKNSADSYRIGENVRVYSGVSRADSLALQKASDILLLLTWNDPVEKGILSAKLFEYIGIGKPIIAVGNYFDEATTIICENSFGFAFKEPKNLADYLLHFIENPHQLNHAAVTNREKFTRIHQVEKLSEIFNSVVEKNVLLNQKVR